MDEFTRTLTRAIQLSNRAAGRTDRKSERDQNEAARLLFDLTRLDHAIELWRKERFQPAIRHADIAEKAFKKILRSEEPKSNRCLAYAVSLAMQEKFQQAETAIAEAQQRGASVAELRQHRQWIKKVSRYFAQESR